MHGKTPLWTSVMAADRPVREIFWTPTEPRSTEKTKSIKKVTLRTAETHWPFGLSALRRWGWGGTQVPSVPEKENHLEVEKQFQKGL